MEKTFINRYGNYILFSVLIGVIAGNSCKTGTENQYDEPPNVIFILADDLGWTQTGVYRSAYYKTPNIDRLAREGLRFTQAYSAAAVCSPTRASVMTGKYPAKIGLTDFIPGNSREEYLLSQPEWQKFLPLEERTLGELFSSHGYSTAMFGKWHLSKDKKPPGSLSHNPDKQGFDEFFITYKPDRSTNPAGDPHNSDTITELGLDFLERKKDSSFFLFLSYNAIHDPLMESHGRISDFDVKPASDKPENHPVVAAMLERMDDNIGKIVDKAEELGLRNNTMIIFFSDNGGKESYADQYPFRKGKGWLYEGGVRVPLIISWEGKVRKNQVSDEQIISNDFFPTFTELLGEDAPRSVDGASILQHILTGEEMEERDLFWHYPHYHHGTGMTPASAVRSGDYKLIEWLEKSLTGKSDFLELYDLNNDPSELENLSDSLPVLRDSLYRKLTNWRREVGAQMPGMN